MQRLLHKIDANGKSYEIKEVHKKYPDSDEGFFLALKEKKGYDALVKNNDFYFFCNEITDVEFIELKNDIITDSINDIKDEITGGDFKNTAAPNN